MVGVSIFFCTINDDRIVHLLLLLAFFGAGGIICDFILLGVCD